MASSKEYLHYIMDQFDDSVPIRSRAMMGEYILYYHDKVIGGIYDDRLLIKPTKSVLALISEPEYESPYEGAKDMILVTEMDDASRMTKLFEAAARDLPAAMSKKNRSKS